MSKVRITDLDAIRPLRHAVLREGQPFETTLYAEDARPDAQHFAAYLDDDVVAIASVYEEVRPMGRGAAWRLRGMASAKAQRGQGYGSAVLQRVMAEAVLRGVEEIWCNAREVAFDFYEAHGFVLLGEFFDIPGIGPHKLMVCHLT